MTDFDDFSRPSLLAELSGEVRLLVRFMAPRDMPDASYGEWPQVWARYADGTWNVLPLQRRGRARQLAALLAMHEGGLRATDAEPLMAGKGLSTKGVSRHARDTLHETLAQEGLAELFPRNDRGGPDKEAWELMHATTDVAVSLAAIGDGRWSTAAWLTDDGEGFLVTFPRYGERDVGRRRLPLRLRKPDEVVEVAGIALPASLVDAAQRAGEAVRRHLRRSVEPHADGVSRTAGGGTASSSIPSKRLLRESVAVEGEGELVFGELVLDPAAPPAIPQVSLLGVDESGEAEPFGLALVSLSALRDRPTPKRLWVRSAATALALTVFAVLLASILGSSEDSRRPLRRYAQHVRLHVENVITSGATASAEDTSPLRLTTRPAANCGRKHCLIFKTARWRFGVFDGAFCQTRGERTTTGDDSSKLDDHNPGLRSTTRYYGVELANGTIGYASAAWLSDRDQGGHGLPECIAVRPVPAPGRAALRLAFSAP